MNGWDFSIMWAAGQAILQGRDPYTIEHFFYPLPFAYFMSFFGVFPQHIAFYMWLALNIGLLIYFFRKKFWHWLFYVPILHMLSSGQVDFFLWSLEQTIQPNWKGALAAAVITLKPQAAFVLLPWHLLKWLKGDWKMLERWFIITLLIWSLPLLVKPNWLSTWLYQTTGLNVQSAANAPSVFSLLKIWPDIWLPLAFLAVVIFIVGQFQVKPIARACALLGSPIGLFYSTMALLDMAPAKLLVPLSLLAALLTILIGNFVPFTMLSVAVLAWNWRKERIKQVELRAFKTISSRVTKPNDSI